MDHIKAWPAPTSKDEVKSFLQTVQFVAQIMRSEKGTNTRKKRSENGRPPLTRRRSREVQKARKEAQRREMKHEN